MAPLVGVVGNLARDRLAGGTARAGGGPYHCARGLRALGAQAAIATKTAADAGLVEQLESLGLPVHWRASSSTAAFGIEYDGETRRMVVEALGEPWTPAEARGWVAEALGGARWVHVAPLARSDFPAETLAALAHGRQLSLDGQGLVRPACTGPLELDGDYDPEVLRFVSILKLAEDEAAVIGVTDGPAILRLGVPEVVVTLGSRGAVVYAGGVVAHVRTRPLEGIDPTGAGDAFAAVYVAARSEGASPTAAASRACTVVGGLLAT
jgi:sugar/nucleoside kinase (ribokinase family)